MFLSYPELVASDMNACETHQVGVGSLDAQAGGPATSWFFLFIYVSAPCYLK
jgi:hypothetical protein